jgi:hypothetical protein
MAWLVLLGEQAAFLGPVNSVGDASTASTHCTGAPPRSNSASKAARLSFEYMIRPNRSFFNIVSSRILVVIAHQISLHSSLYRGAKRDAYENRNGFCVAFSVTPAVGEPESRVAVEQVRELLDRGFDPKTVGADKGYHTKEFVQELAAEGVTAHPALKKGQDVLSVVVDAGY